MEILHRDKAARIGIIRTKHGIIETPFYMPVATKGSIKFIEPHTAIDMGYQCLISNALINYFRPGLPLIKRFGTLHDFMGWHKPITTDSGGFQLLSDSFLIKTTMQGAHFKNPFDGQKHFITPETLMDIQKSLGSDIAMVLDDVPPAGTDKKAVEESMKKTHAWAKRCIEHHGQQGQLLFGIVQGGIFKDLREESARVIGNMDFDGIALGGLAIGEPTRDMFDMIEHTLPLLPDDKARYLMGVGSPQDVLLSIKNGVDMFDSTFPTANARHGTLFTFNGRIKILNAQYTEDITPIEEGCTCYTCTHFSKAFIRHMLKTREPLGKRLTTIHNLHFMQELLHRVKEHIKKGTLDSFIDQYAAVL
ncbi:tRNA guanosine(34) transglycosylase Tgt [Candidatus Woesearchaeota archaeon]|nr:tRNA guanosine(34) transglycosylase Tgt [Candidatus Woesearchaeota archaeon]